MKSLRKTSAVPVTIWALLIMVLGIIAVLQLTAKAQGVAPNGVWSDVGIGAAGSFQENGSGVFAVTDTGTDLWGTNDTFHFVYQPLNGDGQITARILGMNGTNAWAKAGLMVRETLSGNSRYAMELMSAGNGAYFQWRAVDGGETVFGLGDTNALFPYWVRLVRDGDWIGGYSSPDGINWTLVDWVWLDGLAQQVYVGLAFNSHDQYGAASTAWFDQVSLVPANAAEVESPVIGTGDGLAASYFNNRHLYGPPVTNWIDPQIDFDFDALSQKGSERTHEFSIRWTGEVQAQFTEPYTFYVYRDDGVRVWLNEHLIIDDWKSQHPGEVASAPINLVAGRRYLLRVEYFQNYGGAQVSLRWSSPSTPKHVIPQSQLYSQPIMDPDGSGLPVTWELHYFGHTGVDPQADPDGDGLSNLQEYRRYSDPTNPLNWGVPNQWTHGDIEHWGTSDGSARYNNGVFTLSIGCTNNSEHLHYLYQAIGTNGELVARVLSVNGPSSAQAGVMLRETLDSQARNVMMMMTPSNGIGFPLRDTVGGLTVKNQESTNPPTPYWLKVVRNNDWVAGYISDDGQNWTLYDWEYIKGLAPQAFIGLAVSVQNTEALPYARTTAQFDQVQLGPAKPSEILHPVEGTGDGLLANYRNDSLLYLPGITNRVEPEENYYWVHGPPFEFLNPDGYGVCWSGEVQAQFTEPYKFSIQTRREDWVRVWLNDQLIIDGWRKWHPDYKVYSAPVNLVAGRHYLIRVEMYDNLGQGVSILRWTSPSTPEHLISQSQLYSQPAMDPDGSGLPVIWEQIYFGHTGVDPHADPDGDGLSNLQEYQYHTNPLKADTDGDGIPDAWEIAHGLDPQFDDAGFDYDNSGWDNLQAYLYGLDPLNPDMNNDGLPDVFEVADLGLDATVSHANLTSVAASVDGAQATNFLGRWAVDGHELYALDRRGGMDFILSVTNADKYVLNLIGTQNEPDSSVTKFKLLLGIDGQTLGHYTLNAPYGTDGKVEVVLPYLRAGSHTLHVFWDGVASFSSLRIKQVELLAVSGTATNQTGLKDWVLKMVHAESGLDLTNQVIGSYTSPVCLEGRDPYPLFTTMSDNQTNALSQHWTTDNRWYVNVPLQAGTPTEFKASYQNGAISESRNLRWLELNLLTAANNLTIRQGDSLLFNAFPTNGANGSLQIALGANTYTSKTVNPIPYRFTIPGTYTVTGTYTSPRGLSQSGSITVHVVQQDLPNVQPAAWTGMERALNLTKAPETVLQADSRLICFISATNAANHVQLTLGADANEPRSIIARLGTNGPVLGSMPVSGFDVWAGDQAYTRVLQTYPDGSQLVEMLMISSPVETNVTFVIQPIVSGVMFDDGTMLKTITATNFDALGQCPIRFIRPASVMTSVCNSVKAYQGNYQLGYLH